MASDSDRGGPPRHHCIIKSRRSISQKRPRDDAEDTTIVSAAKKEKKQSKVIIDLTSDSGSDTEEQAQSAQEQLALAQHCQEPGFGTRQPWQQQHPTGNIATLKDGTSSRAVTQSSVLLTSHFNFNFSKLFQKDPSNLERRSLFQSVSSSIEPDHSLITPSTQPQSHKTDSNTLVPIGATKPVCTESQQKGMTRGPIKASMRGGVRGTPPPKRKRPESSQRSTEAVLVPVISEDTHSNVSHRSSVSQTDTSGYDSLTETDGTSKARQKRTRCNKCGPCLMPDCGECSYCNDKGRYRKACKKRKDCVTWSSTLEATSHQGEGEGDSTSSNVQPTASSLTRTAPEPAQPVDRSTSLDSESDVTNDDDESFQQLFDEAMEGCEVSVFIAKCGVTGPPGTGKSHLRAMILNKKRPVARQSTAIAAEADQATPDWINFEEDLVEIDEMKDGSRVKWYMIDTSKMSGLAAKTMYRHQNLKHKAQEQVSSTTSVESVRSVQSSTGTRLKFKVTTKIRKRLKELQRKANRKRKCLDKMKLVYLVDAGGQPQFQEIMPMFVRNSSVNILVHKLPEKLSDRPTFDYEVDGTKFSVPEEMLVTNKEMIEQSVRSICSCNLTNSIRQRSSSRPPKPFVAIVGMFKDKCSDRELEEKQVGIKECLAIYEKEKLIEVCRPSRDKPVFAFDASELGWANNGEMLATLRTNIQQICESLEVKIPLRWFIFLEIFKEYSKGKNYISLQECYDIARDSDVHMSEDQVDEALQLFDELNMILQFSDILPNVVFCKPEFLFNKVSQMIVASFDCKQSVDIAQSEREEFRKTGVFSTELLSKTRHVFDDLNSLFTRDDLLDLLTNLCIVAFLRNDRYFMPCVLPLESFESNLPVYVKYRRIMSDSGIKGPLFVSFGTEFTPRGLFCASIAYLAKLSSWIINPNHSPSDLYRKRNVIEFEFHSLDSHDIHGQTSFEGTVLIADRMTHFEVYSTCDKQHCPEIRKEIYLAFWHAAKSLSYDPRELDITVGFVCQIPCGMPKPHGTAVKFRKESGATERCLRNRSKRPIPLAQNKEVWFNKVGTAPDSNPSSDTVTVPLSLSLLMNEVASKTEKWQNIGLQLELEHVDIQKINLEQTHKIDDCFREMFAQWERRCTSPYTWKTVIEALEAPSVDEQFIARDLRRKYLEQGQSTKPQQSQLQQQESYASTLSHLHVGEESQDTENNGSEIQLQQQEDSQGFHNNQLTLTTSSRGLDKVPTPSLIPGHNYASTSRCIEDQITAESLPQQQLSQAQELALKSSEAILETNSHKLINCQFHKDELLKFYCEQCKTHICRNCALLEHSGHKYNQVEKVAEEKKDLLSTLKESEQFGNNSQGPSSSQTSAEDISAIPKSLIIWQFILYLLTNNKHQNVISWLNKDERDFQIHDTTAFAKLWGQHKGKQNPTSWKNVSSNIGTYYKKNILTKTGGRQEHTYKFSTTSLEEYQATAGLRITLPEITEPPVSEAPQLNAMNQDEETSESTQETKSSSELEVNKEELQETEIEMPTTLKFVTSDFESNSITDSEYVDQTLMLCKQHDLDTADSEQSQDELMIETNLQLSAELIELQGQNRFLADENEYLKLKLQNKSKESEYLEESQKKMKSNWKEILERMKKDSVEQIDQLQQQLTQKLTLIQTQLEQKTAEVEEKSALVKQLKEEVEKLIQKQSFNEQQQLEMNLREIESTAYSLSSERHLEEVKLELDHTKIEAEDKKKEIETHVHTQNLATKPIEHTVSQLSANLGAKYQQDITKCTITLRKHVLFSKKLSRVVSQYYRCTEHSTYIPFIDPVEVLVCDHYGIEHTLVDHDITLSIPKGAVPKGKVVHIEIAVTLYGPFRFPSGTRPISPILWLCPQEEIEFNSPILVTLPHFLTGFNSSQQELGVSFAKADHNASYYGSAGFEFEACSVKPQFSYKDDQGFATLGTKHCCYICLTANQCPELARMAGFLFLRFDCLSKSSTYVVNFCVTFFLQSCLKVLKSQFPSCARDIRRRRFTFKHCDDGTNAHLAIAVQNPFKDQYDDDVDPMNGMIDMMSVDFWARERYTVDEIQLEQDNEMYPPRVTVNFIPKASSTVTEACTMMATVTGSSDNLDSKIILPLVSRFPSSTGTNGESPNGHLQSSASNDNGLLTERNHLDIYRFINPLEKTDIILLGQALGLLRSNLKKMAMIPHDMIDAWLIQADDVLEKSGPPTWKSLCKALEDISQSGIADKIKQKRVYHQNIKPKTEYC